VKFSVKILASAAPPDTRRLAKLSAERRAAFVCHSQTKTHFVAGVRHRRLPHETPPPPGGFLLSKNVIADT